MAKKDKRLYRSRTNWLVSGVCGGLGEFFGADPSLIRIGWVLLTILTGFLPMIAVYVICAILIPLEPKTSKPAVVSGLFKAR